MNRTLTLSLFFAFTLLNSVSAQHILSEGNGSLLQNNDAVNPCLTEDQYALIEKECEENSKALNMPAVFNKKQSVSFSWPLKTKAGVTDYSYYTISAHVDQDKLSGTFKDYNCGTMSYDGHKGTDIAMWPYPFYKMDNDIVEVIAAASGTIITKVDGQFDKNCNTVANNNLTPNHIILQHSDGSRSLYLHMKKNSLTAKKVGDTVEQGEYLGIVGSSGSSSGPHLHFEVWSGSTSATLVDPFEGSCNKLNATSLWASQKTYTEPAVIKASVNPVTAVIPTCPGTETPNESYCHTSGVDKQAQFYVFMRNETPSLVMNMRIVNPNGSTFGKSWTRTNGNTQNYPGTYSWYTKYLPSTPGIYTFEIIYNGITTLVPFEVDCAVTGIETGTDLNRFNIYPNPVNSTFNIEEEGVQNGNYKFTLRNCIGKIVKEESSLVENNLIKKNLSVTGLSDGVYFLTIETSKSAVVKKLIVQK